MSFDDIAGPFDLRSWSLRWHSAFVSGVRIQLADSLTLLAHPMGLEFTSSSRFGAVIRSAVSAGKSSFWSFKKGGVSAVAAGGTDFMRFGLDVRDSFLGATFGFDTLGRRWTSFNWRGFDIGASSVGEVSIAATDKDGRVGGFFGYSRARHEIICGVGSCVVLESFLIKGFMTLPSWRGSATVLFPLPFLGADGRLTFEQIESGFGVGCLLTRGRVCLGLRQRRASGKWSAGMLLSIESNSQSMPSHGACIGCVTT